jgi:hypothetical protein
MQPPRSVILFFLPAVVLICLLPACFFLLRVDRGLAAAAAAPTSVAQRLYLEPIFLRPTVETQTQLGLHHSSLRNNLPDSIYWHGMADGCANIYLDFGSNVGIQVRKLYEPSLYPEAKILPFFDAYLGDVEERRRTTCAFGFEINPHHSLRLKALEVAYARMGWATRFFTETGVGMRTEFADYKTDNQPKSYEWAARLVDEGQGDVTVRVVNLLQVVDEGIMRRKVPSRTAGARPPTVVAKLDIVSATMLLVVFLLCATPHTCLYSSLNTHTRNKTGGQ